MPPPSPPPPPPGALARTRAWARAFAQAQLERTSRALDRVRLPAPSVLPVAGAVVGLYSGLAAGLFANLIGLVTGLAFAVPRAGGWLRLGRRVPLGQAFERAAWHPELLAVGVPLALGALVLARLVPQGAAHHEVRRRLRVLGLLVLAGLALYYPLVALGAVNVALGTSHGLGAHLRAVPWLVVLLAPMVGGGVVGRLLRDRPATRGHGVPEVVQALRRDGEGLAARDGLLKLVASAVTIGSGGSAGREGPIVFGGAAFGAAVGRTLGFSRQQLGVLLAAGAGAGIAASFNAPIAGALFAMEILLARVEVAVLSPILLACVSATLVGRGVMGSAPVLARVPYQMVSGWEVLAYAGLGLVCGLVAYGFIRALHALEDLFEGRRPNALSRGLARLPRWGRAALGGLGAGALALVHPAVWGTGHEYANAATLGQLTLLSLAVGCLLKVVATALTLGSGGSGGTFFPATVMGALAGGAFGALVHAALPGVTAPSGAYALVGMGGAVAALTRGPLTGMVMVYELSGNYAVILPLMVTCSLASALCHALVERAHRRRLGADAGLPTVEAATRWTPGVAASLTVGQLRGRLVDEGALVVVDGRGTALGLLSASALEAGLLDRPAGAAVHGGPVVPAGASLREALATLEAEGVHALAVQDGPRVGVVTRTRVREALEARAFAPVELGVGARR